MYNQATRTPFKVLKRKIYTVTVLNPSTDGRESFEVSAVTRKDAVLDTLAKYRAEHKIASSVQLFCESVSEKKLTVGASAGVGTPAAPKQKSVPRPPAPWIGANA